MTYRTILTQISVKNCVRGNLRTLQLQIPPGTEYVSRHRVKIEIQLPTAAAIFNGLSFGGIPQPGSNKTLHGSIGALSVHSYTHENRGFTRFVEFCPADVKKQAECCPFHRHFFKGYKDTIPSAACQDVKQCNIKNYIQFGVLFQSQIRYTE